MAYRRPFSKDDNPDVHSLLEPAPPKYSNEILCRAFLLWLHCDLPNEFKYICHFIRRFRPWEGSMSPGEWFFNHYSDFDQLIRQPPTLYLHTHFPLLFKVKGQNEIIWNKAEGLSYYDRDVNMRIFHYLYIRKDVLIEDLLTMCNTMRIYCNVHSINSVTRLLEQYQHYINVTKLRMSFDNLSIFVKQLFLKDDLVLHMNGPKHFDFVDECDVADQSVEDVIENSEVVVDKNTQKSNLKPKQSDILDSVEDVADQSVEDVIEKSVGAVDKNTLKPTLKPKHFDFLVRVENVDQSVEKDVTEKAAGAIDMTTVKPTLKPKHSDFLVRVENVVDQSVDDVIEKSAGAVDRNILKCTVNKKNKDKEHERSTCEAKSTTKTKQKQSHPKNNKSQKGNKKVSNNKKKK